MELEACERKAFGTAGLNRWLLPIVALYGHLFVLTKNGQISGAASFIKNRKSAFLIGVWVKTGMQRQGYGENLLKQAFAELEKSRIEEIELTVQENNVAARKLYQKLGFRVNRRIKDFYGPRQDRLLLRYNLLK